MDYRDSAQRMIQKTASLNRLMARTAMKEYWKGEMYILFHLYERESATPGELSAAMEISTARVAATLNALEEKELILRRMSEKDRRKILVTLTEKGREHVRKQQENLLADTEAILKELGEKDAKEYLRILDRIIERVEARITINK